MLRFFFAVVFAAIMGGCGCSAQSAQAMADHIEKMIHQTGVKGNCAACSAVAESLYKVIAWGKGHHVNDAAELLPKVLETSATSFSYKPDEDLWYRLPEPSSTPEPHMIHYLEEHILKPHHMMVVLSPYYLQNERHHLHQILCVDLLQHCREGFVLPAHSDDIHAEYDLANRGGEL